MSLYQAEFTGFLGNQMDDLDYKGYVLTKTEE